MSLTGRTYIVTLEGVEQRSYASKDAAVNAAKGLLAANPLCTVMIRVRRYDNVWKKHFYSDFPLSYFL